MRNALILLFLWITAFKAQMQIFIDKRIFLIMSLDGYPLFFTIKYSQGQDTCSCTGATGEREASFGVVCESVLGRRLFIDIVCSNAVGS